MLSRCGVNNHCLLRYLIHLLLHLVLGGNATMICLYFIDVTCPFCEEFSGKTTIGNRFCWVGR
uniref:Uncharacterized protein n=1 Tax=Anopheles atroparvus TaxID=41427 RepID=A0AAG5DUJ6_ANOAO